ncbi:kinase-like domain-containing protein [Penicillium capsulatum]|uniref:Kinase-like domain-containing protein n=1 Tax=Penicillium capsulatum TaxID=69766 RepID=A0A9W9HSL5_9EURO|nr:kinase-like domain-containing protein [Penicillium capsulatum]KAJ6106075.1 kinase-like domain-containing protein [Penicillium capsulatum]
MDYIPGRTLEQAWPTMTDEQKTTVSEELHGYLMQIRNLKGMYIGGHNHGTASVGKHIPHQGGPFASEKLFNEFLFSEIIDTVPEVPHYYAKNSFRDDHKIVSTQGDLAPRNITVDDDCLVSAILDCEMGGWYPAWWEHFKFYYVVHQVKKWEPYVSTILPPEFSTEFCAMFYLYCLR